MRSIVIFPSLLFNWIAFAPHTLDAWVRFKSLYNWKYAFTCHNCHIQNINEKCRTMERKCVGMYVRSPLKAVLVLHHLTGTTLKRQKHVLSWNVTRRQWRRPMSNKEWRCALWYVATTFNHEKCPNVHKLQHNIVCLKLTPNYSVIIILTACSILKILIT